MVYTRDIVGTITAYAITSYDIGRNSSDDISSLYYKQQKRFLSKILFLQIKTKFRAELSAKYKFAATRRQEPIDKIKIKVMGKFPFQIFKNWRIIKITY